MMKTKKTKIAKYILIVVVLLCAGLLFWTQWYRHHLPKDFALSSSSSQTVRYGARQDYDVSCGEDGLFYSESTMAGSLLKYYDTDSKTSYVLCNKPNCLHNSTSCNAFFPISGLDSPYALENVAEHNGYVYCTTYNLDVGVSSTMDFVQVQPNGGTRKVLLSLPGSFGSTPGEIYCSSISSVYYCGDYAWLTLHLSDNRNDFIQICGVNLKSGAITYINEEYDDWEYTVRFVTPDYVFLTGTHLIDEEIDFYTYNETYGNGPSQIDGQTFETYNDYWIWYQNGTEDYVSLAYRISDGEMITLKSGRTERDEKIGHSIQGVYDGKVLLWEYEYNLKRCILTLVDLNTGDEEPVLTIDDGDLLKIAQGYYVGSILSDNTFLYLKRIDEEYADIYSYNMDTKTSTFLFRDASNITFRIFAEYRDGYFGKMADAQDTMTFYWIAKEDFLAGNLDAAVKYQL